MKRLTALIANLGILFFAGNKGTFKTFDFPLYPIVIYNKERKVCQKDGGMYYTDGTEPAGCYVKMDKENGKMS